MSWLDPRTWLAVLMAVGLSYGVGHWRGDSAGRAQVAAASAKEAFRASEAARQKEQELQTKVEKVANEYQTEKTRRAADRAVSAGRLSELQATLDRGPGTDTTTASGADDPRGAVINQCASALVGLDEYAQGVAAKARALQDYSREVCVN